MKPDIEAAVAFLNWLCPCGQWRLTASNKDKKVFLSKHFTSMDGMAAWIAEHNATSNIYYALNPLRTAKDKKAGKKDVAAGAWLHVDIDSGAGTPQELAPILARLKAYQHPPTAIVMSGGGYNALWRLREALPLGGPEAIAEIEQRNIQLAIDLGGDDCENVDRILRLPGTINWPDVSKRKRGRVPALAALEYSDDDNYDISRFMAAPPKGAPAPQVEASAPSGGLAALHFMRPAYLKVLREGADADPDKFKGDRSKALMAVVGEMVRLGIHREAARPILKDPANKVSEHVLAQKEQDRAIDRAFDEAEAAPLVLPREDHLFRARCFRQRVIPSLLCWGRTFYRYERGRYQEENRGSLRSQLSYFLGNAQCLIKAGLVPFPVNKKVLEETLTALEDTCHLLDDPEVPCWFPGINGEPVENLVSFPNGILHLLTGDFYRPLPTLITFNAVGFDYEPAAPAPVAWLRFLGQVFAGEADQTALLQEFMGYCLMQTAPYHKMLLLVGLPRSGKGTILKVVRALLPPNSSISPKLEDLSQRFGRQQMIGKQVVIFPDVRIGRNYDKLLSASETLLSISGGDAQTTDRKNKDHWTGRIDVKFVMTSNKLPTLPDDSGVLATRFLTVRTRASFLGKEDVTLFDNKLLPEMGGILTWALEGLRRLKERGRFSETRVSEESQAELKILQSYVHRYVNDRCTLGIEQVVAKRDVYTDYVRWCEAQKEKPINDAIFAKDLYEAFPQVSQARLRGHAAGKQVMSYVGISLKATAPRGEDAENAMRTV